MEETQARSAQPQYLHSWSGLSLLTEALLWARYGYWQPDADPPEWYEAELALAKQAAERARPPLTHSHIRGHYEDGAFVGAFTLWDEANPWVEPSETQFRYQSEQGVKAHYAQRALEKVSLHEGVINALIAYGAHGLAVPPAWYSEGQRFWLRRDYDPARHRGRKETL